MKRKTSMILLAALTAASMALTACGGSGAQTAEPAAETEEAPSVSAAAVSVIETEEASAVNAGTVAAAALDIVAAYTETNTEDVSSLEKLQSDILDWMESYESLSQEDQALLSESMSYVQAIAAEIEGLQKLSKRFPCKKRLVLTYDEEDVITDCYGEIYIIPVWKWLLNK